MNAPNPYVQFVPQVTQPKHSGLGIFFLGSILLTVIGGSLGVITCFQKDKKKVLRIIGLVLNALIVFGVVILMVIGFVVDA